MIYLNIALPFIIINSYLEMPVLRVVVYKKGKMYSCVISLILPTGLCFVAASSGCGRLLAAVTGMAECATSGVTHPPAGLLYT